MKIIRPILLLILTAVILLISVSCTSNTISKKDGEVTTVAQSPQPKDIIEVAQKNTTGKIYLYGEFHGVKELYDNQIEVWFKYYHEEGMRHLFIEKSYGTAQFLNLWMKSDNDEIIDSILTKENTGLNYTPLMVEFYKAIKDKYPETIFHGTDVGHQYNTTGKRYKNYLEDNNMKDTQMYKLTLESIEQGKLYHMYKNNEYREKKWLKISCESLKVLTAKV